MSRRFINQLGEGEQVDQVFLVADKQLRTNRNGNLYLQLRLQDRSGAVTAMLWNANDRVSSGFESGDYLRVTGATQFYNNGLQIIAKGVERVEASEIDEADFTTMAAADLERLTGRLGELLATLKNVHLRRLAQRFLGDESFMAELSAAPAGIKHHHAFRGGLLQHVVQLMELAADVAVHYPQVDGELLLCGAFLHDVGKTRELRYEREMVYSDEGQLIGHLVIGVQILNEKIGEVESGSGEEFPDELRWRLQHMIVSHHGSVEFGSPKVPMTLEAVVLHYLDSLDAKVHAYLQLVDEDVNAESTWTPFHAPTGRKLFKPSFGEGASPQDSGPSE